MTVRRNRLRALPLPALVVRVALLGAAAGIVAWTAVLAAHLLFDVGRPSRLELALAIPRGALFGAIAACILHAWWKRHPSGGAPEDR